MAMEAAYRNAIGDHGATLATHVSLHSAFPATLGNELAVTRQAITWGAAADGLITASSVPHDFTVPAGATVGAVGYHSALTAGTVQGGDDVTDEAFASEGTYSVTALTINHATPA